MRLRRTDSDDTGASLVIVMLLVTVFGLVLSASLGLVTANLRTTVAVRDTGARGYTADGAAQAALNTIRNSTFAGTGGCFGGSDTLSLPGFSTTGSAAVACTADPKRVLIQCPALNRCNRPGNAILTLGDYAGEDGITVSQPTGSEFRVHGVVYSQSTIKVNNGKLNTNTAVYARKACSGTIVSVPAAQCTFTGTYDLGADPRYSPDVSAAPAYRGLPACTAANPLVTFAPGYYDDAKGLSDMMSNSSPCKDSTWWFQPGTYYFDFHNTGANANPLLTSNGGNVWTVNSGKLIAGTRTGTDRIPGSCDNPISNANAQGVQFIFGGDSQLVVKSGEVEICGSYSSTKPPVAIYGLTSAAAPNPEATTVDTTVLNAVPTPGSYGASATVANLSTADGTTFATWTAEHNNDTGTVTVSGFAPTAAIPAGSILKSAVLKVTHRHTDTTTSDRLTGVTVTANGRSAINLTGAGNPGGVAFKTDALTVDSGTDELAKAVYAGNFTGATVSLSTKLSNNNDVENLDAIRLELSYVKPQLRAGTGCVTATPYLGTGSGPCALVTAQQFSSNQFYVQGTTYAPGAALDIALNNATQDVFRFGVVARTLQFKGTGSATYTGPVIEVPDDAPGLALSVFLTVTVCEGATTCTPGAAPAVLSVRAAFVDPDSTPVAGKRQVIILSWAGPG